MKRFLLFLLLLPLFASAQITPAQDTTLMTPNTPVTLQQRVSQQTLSGTSYRMLQMYNSILGKYDTYPTTKYLRAFYAPLSSVPTYTAGYGLNLTGSQFKVDTSAIQTIANFKPLGSTYFIQNKYGVNTTQSNSKIAVSDSIKTSTGGFSNQFRADSLMISDRGNSGQPNNQYFFRVGNMKSVYPTEANTKLLLGRLQASGPSTFREVRAYNLSSDGAFAILGGYENNQATHGQIAIGDRHYTTSPHYFGFYSNNMVQYWAFGNNFSNQFIDANYPATTTTHIMSADSVGNVIMLQPGASFTTYQAKYSAARPLSSLDFVYKQKADSLYAPISTVGYVTYTGAASDLDLGAHKATAAFINLPAQGSNPTAPSSGVNLYGSFAGNRLSFMGANGYEAIFSTQSLIAAASYSLPRNSGLLYAAASNAAGSIPYATNGVTTTSLPIGSSGDVLTVSGGLPIWSPPVGFSNPMTTLGDIIYGGASGVPTRLAGNITTPRKFLTSTGTGSAATAPAYFDLFGTINNFNTSQVFTGGLSTSLSTYFSGSYGGTISAGTLSNDRNYTLPDANGTIALTSNIADSLSATNKFSRIRGQYILANKTNVGTLFTYTTIADGMYQVSSSFKTTAISTNTYRLKVTYTDLQNAANSNQTNTVSGVGTVNNVPISFLCKAGTVITVLTENVVSGGTQTYDIGATLVQL